MNQGLAGTGGRNERGIFRALCGRGLQRPFMAFWEPEKQSLSSKHGLEIDNSFRRRQGQMERRAWQISLNRRKRPHHA